MPPLPPVASVIRLHLKHTVGSDIDVLPRFYIQYSGTAPTAAQMNTFCTAIAGSWNTVLAPYASAEVTLTEVTGEDLTSATSASGSASVSHAGSRSGNLVSASTCSMLNFGVNRRYRGGKARIYLPYLTNQDILTPQTWIAASISGLAGAWGTFMGDIIGEPWSGGTITGQVNVSFYNGFTVVTSPTTGRSRNVPKLRVTPLIDPIVSTTGLNRYASQRRRNAGGG